MAVVINEFEIIAEPPAQSTTPAPSSGGRQTPPADRAVRATDIINIVERHQQRLARLYAD